MLKNNCTDAKSFIEDMADVLCVLNDNDTHPRFRIEVDEAVLLNHIGEDSNIAWSEIDPKDYAEIRQRKARQMRGILEKQNKNNSPTVEVVGGKEEK